MICKQNRWELGLKEIKGACLTSWNLGGGGIVDLSVDDSNNTVEMEQ